MVKIKNLVQFLGLAWCQKINSSHSTRDARARVIHPGSREELYETPILASQLMNKYPGMWVARPQVFRKPHESILCPGESLVPGQKYYMIPSTTAMKLKRKFQPRPGPVVEGKSAGNGNLVEEMPEEKRSPESAGECWFCDDGTGSMCFTRKKGMGKKKRSVPPIPKEKACRSVGWEPSLTSVQELSP